MRNARYKEKGISPARHSFSEGGWLSEFNTSASSASPREENECVRNITRGVAEISGER